MKEKPLELNSRIGLLTVLEKAGHDRNGTILYRCKCDCGNVIEVKSCSLLAGRYKSCGCAKNKRGRLSYSSEYSIWTGMIRRYGKPNNNGIAVREEWLGDNGFTRFLKDMGNRPSLEHNLRRVDNTKGFYKANCQWANAAIPQGTKFGMLTVIDLAQKTDKRIRYTCLCKCGKRVDIRNDALISGRVKSCGCLHKSGSYNETGHNKRHSGCRTIEYNLWCNMIARCNNPKRNDYYLYGGRGIKVCPQWKGRGGFEQFIKDIKYRPNKKYSLDRINNNGNYEPTNVRWADKITQVKNRRKVCDLSSFPDSQILAELIKRGAAKQNG